jgi:acyl-lipid omega-6 desaturase (Delta-12 desaturase)
LNLRIQQPLHAEGRVDVLTREPHTAPRPTPVIDSEPMHETQKQRVRRLAAHCQKYRGSVPKLAVRQLITTLVPLVVVIGAMFATVESAYWATLLLALPAAGLLVRAFISQHDCGHASFHRARPTTLSAGA